VHINFFQYSLLAASDYGSINLWTAANTRRMYSNDRELGHDTVP
jgi:hypothetical protein